MNLPNPRMVISRIFYCSAKKIKKIMNIKKEIIFHEHMISIAKEMNEVESIMENSLLWIWRGRHGGQYWARISSKAHRGHFIRQAWEARKALNFLKEKYKQYEITHKSTTT